MPSAHRACHLGFFQHNNAAVAALWAFLSCLLFAASAQAQVTLLVPSQPSVEAPSPRPKQDVPAKREDKKETLDIIISDAAGPREYELFSGGEAFRVNFAIRLALSRVLAQRAGARLQTLVIDEGFGSQDAEGRQRLIEAINRRDYPVLQGGMLLLGTVVMVVNLLVDVTYGIINPRIRVGH